MGRSAMKHLKTLLARQHSAIKNLSDNLWIHSATEVQKDSNP